jgi:hypothetical protein
VNRERAELLERLPPEESARLDVESWRRRLMARDRNGDLQHARAAGQKAAALARSPDERFEAALWLGLIECDAGRHKEELKQARRMMQIRPRDLLALTAHRRAAQCNGLTSLERQAAAALKELPPSDPARRMLAPGSEYDGSAPSPSYDREGG